MVVTLVRNRLKRLGWGAFAEDMLWLTFIITAGLVIVVACGDQSLNSPTTAAEAA